MRLLVVNAGSSSLKLTLLDGDATVDTRTVESWDGESEPIRQLAESAGHVDVVGHRVVHGGSDFTEAVLVDDSVLTQLRGLVSLAPLHQPRTLTAIDAARRALPTVDQVACFDTAFHATLPAAAYTYALPLEWRSRWPLRRFGFHGLSHAYASRRAAHLAGRPVGELRIVSCHLGAGASICAIDGGRSVDTTMGFTPLEGLVMATRAGSVDPGLVLWLITEAGLSPIVVLDGLERASGLVGLAGNGDLRAVLAARARGDADSELAFSVYVHRLRRELGAMIGVLDDVDLVAFTGGVGEHAPAVRAAAGLPVDSERNARTFTDGEITATGADVRAFVITAREDLEIARQVGELVS